jgi:phosphohistidine phosphatase
MKVLTLLRHAKAGAEPLTMRDFDRPLVARGRSGARLIGREMKALGLGFDSVLASPAARAAQTVTEIEAEFGPLGAQFDQRLYLADLHSLFEVVHETLDDVERLLIVGHNPGIEMLALSVGGLEPPSVRESVASKYPTGTLAEIALEADRWVDVAQGSGRIARFIRPRDLDPALGPED